MKTILTTVVAIAMSAIMLLTGIGPIAGNADMGIGKENGVVYKTEDIDDFITEEQTVESVEIITDFAGNRFKLYELSPTGYAIYSLQGEASIFIEGSYATNSPYYGAENGKYYLGIGEYFTETSARSKEVRSVVTGKTVEKEELLGATFAVDEKHYKKGEGIRATFPSTPDPNKTVTTGDGFTKIKDYRYFVNLTEFPTNNSGTCGLVAICMLLGYYDGKIDDAIIVDDNYVVLGNDGRTIGTTEYFQSYLFANCLHTSAELNLSFLGYPMGSGEINMTITDYVNMKGLTAVKQRFSHEGSYVFPKDKAKTYINGGQPVIITLISYQRVDPDNVNNMLTESFHNVVAYGYDSLDRFYVHLGWKGRSIYSQTIISSVFLNSFYVFNHSWA